jgi:hypothetical protein
VNIPDVVVLMQFNGVLQDREKFELRQLSHGVYGRPRLIKQISGLDLETYVHHIGLNVTKTGSKYEYRGEHISDLAEWAYKVTGDEFIQFFTARELAKPPNPPTITTINTAESFLKRSREFRSRNELVNKLSKRLQGGHKGTFHKFPPLTGKVLHVGSGMYGASSMSHTECVRIDPLSGGSVIQNLTNSYLKTFDVVVSDVAVPGDAGGLSPNQTLRDFVARAKRFCRVIYKCHLADAKDPIIIKPRPHNMEVICDTEAVESLVLNDILGGIVSSNVARNQIHQGHFSAFDIASGVLDVERDDEAVFALCKAVPFELPHLKKANFAIRQSPTSWDPATFRSMVDNMLYPSACDVAFDVLTIVQDMSDLDRYDYLESGAHGLSLQEAVMVEWTIRFQQKTAKL